ncbi:hypothetical protein D3C85_1499390 [compost metagenome]
MEEQVQLGQQLAFGQPPVAEKRVLRPAHVEAIALEEKTVGALYELQLQTEVIPVEDGIAQQLRPPIHQAWSAHALPCCWMIHC